MVVIALLMPGLLVFTPFGLDALENHLSPRHAGRSRADDGQPLKTP
ncbi:hypothetical protein AB0E83_09300 [Streptomyces sp. NPDC035033]